MISPSDNTNLDDRDDFDALITSAMVDVPVVEGLESRILQRLSQAPDVKSSQAGESDSKSTISIAPTASQQLRRRWVLGAASTVAALLVLAAVVVPMLDFAKPPQVRLVDLEFWANAVDEKVLANLEPYPGTTPVVWPTGRWRNDLSASKPLALSIASNDDAAVLAAFAETNINVKRKTVYCRVIVIPAENVSGLPSASNVASGTNTYHKDFVTTTWTENDHVYVVACRNVADLELLQDYAFGGAV